MINLNVIPVMAGRPYVTDDAGTVGLGLFELETTPNYWKDRVDFGLCFKHGLTDRMEIGVAMGHCTLPKEERGIQNAELGFKFALIPDLFAASFTGVFGDPGYAFNFILGKAYKNFTVNANLGGSMVAKTEDADLTYGLSGIFTYGRFETGAEIGGTQEELNWWQIGAKIFVTDWCSIDAGIGGDFEKEVSMNATTGLWFAFPFVK
jgi:hypothetical protein